MRLWSVELDSSALPSAPAPSLPIELKRRLQTKVRMQCQRVVSVMFGQEGRLAAYSSVWSVEFALRPSERCLAAAALRLLFLRLQTRVKMACQRLLTLEMVLRWCAGPLTPMR